ncbi:MAG: MerR family transcriptional regulator [Pseudomonadota bacterium]
MAEKATNAVSEKTFGIGAVARLTGLTDHTIRVWERRYDAIVAERAANGRRVYTGTDIEKLKLLKLLTDQGLSIGRIANEPVDELRQRAREIRELAAPAEPLESIDVAIFGEMLPALIQAEERQLGPVQVRVTDSLEERFLTDLGQQSVDVLVIELPVIGADTSERLRRYQDVARTERVVCIYGFAQSRDAAALQDAGVILLRSPVTADEAVQAIIRAAGETGAGAGTTHVPDVLPLDEHDDDEPIPPRLFTQQQLSSLARVSSTIECECPQHLAQLVGALSSFEIYSANCANRNEDDAALHRYLHRTSASARAQIEKALERVAREEGLL